jgi:hypothetical protein
MLHHKLQISLHSHNIDSLRTQQRNFQQVSRKACTLWPILESQPLFNSSIFCRNLAFHHWAILISAQCETCFNSDEQAIKGSHCTYNRDRFHSVHSLRASAKSYFAYCIGCNKRICSSLPHHDLFQKCLSLSTKVGIHLADSSPILSPRFCCATIVLAPSTLHPYTSKVFCRQCAIDFHFQTIIDINQCKSAFCKEMLYRNFIAPGFKFIQQPSLRNRIFIATHMQNDGHHYYPYIRQFLDFLLTNRIHIEQHTIFPWPSDASWHDSNGGIIHSREFFPTDGTIDYEDVPVRYLLSIRLYSEDHNPTLPVGSVVDSYVGNIYYPPRIHFFGIDRQPSANIFW